MESDNLKNLNSQAIFRRHNVSNQDELNQKMFTNIEEYDRVDGELIFEKWINILAINRQMTNFEYLRTIVERKIRE